MLKKILIIVGLLGISILSLFIYHSFFKERIAFIDIPKVFNDFEMKKELSDKYKIVEQQRKRLLDSLTMDLQLVSSELRKQVKPDQNLVKEFDIKRNNYLTIKARVEEDNAVLSNQYDKQILERLSQYVVEYGKKYNYDIILGADGNGTLMYAKEELNISAPVTEFINNKYKGIE